MSPVVDGAAGFFRRFASQGDDFGYLHSREFTARTAEGCVAKRFLDCSTESGFGFAALDSDQRFV